MISAGLGTDAYFFTFSLLCLFFIFSSTKTVTSYQVGRLNSRRVSGISGMEWTTGMEYWNGLGQNLFTCT